MLTKEQFENLSFEDQVKLMYEDTDVEYLVDQVNGVEVDPLEDDRKYGTLDSEWAEICTENPEIVTYDNYLTYIL
jgi:hypothetical protein